MDNIAKKTAKVYVSSERLELESSGRCVELSLRAGAQSLFDRRSGLQTAVEGLALLAKPQKIELVFIVPESDWAPVEFACADDLIARTGAVRGIWRKTRASAENFPIEPKAEEIFESPGWAFMRTLNRGEEGDLTISEGLVSVTWGGASIEAPIARHSRLMVPDFVSLANAVIGAKRELGIPHGGRLRIRSGADRELGPLESRVVAEALNMAQLEPATRPSAKSMDPSSALERPDSSLGIYELFEVLVVLGIFFLLLYGVSSLGFPAWVFFVPGLLLPFCGALLRQRRDRCERRKRIEKAIRNITPRPAQGA